MGGVGRSTWSEVAVGLCRWGLNRLLQEGTVVGFRIEKLSDDLVEDEGMKGMSKILLRQ